MRVKRIGSTTSGLTLIAAGLAFLANSILNSYAVLDWTLRLWPLVLVSLGIEVLLSQRIKENVEKKYDFLSVFMTIFCILTALGCEVARIALYESGFLR